MRAGAKSSRSMTLSQSRNPPSTHKAYLLARGKLIAARGCRRSLRSHVTSRPTRTERSRLRPAKRYPSGTATAIRGPERVSGEPGNSGVKEHGAIDGWVSVPWGEGFFYLSNRRLMRSRPARTTTGSRSCRMSKTSSTSLAWTGRPR